MDLIIGFGVLFGEWPQERETKSVSFTHHLLIVGLEMKVACVEYLLEVKALVAWSYCMFITHTASMYLCSRYRTMWSFSSHYCSHQAPEALMTLLTKFWEDNKGLEYPEQWGTGNTYVNHWEMPSYMLSVENRELKGGGSELKAMIWDAAVDSVREWTGQDLTTSSLYGIRVYKEGAVLAPHVDRLPLVSSCIINVAQDVDEPWPLEVYTHDGIARNITMEVRRSSTKNMYPFVTWIYFLLWYRHNAHIYFPSFSNIFIKPGDMVLYESHSVVHGRPFPLKGRYFANVFIHFQPVLGEDFGSMPSYIIPNSPEAKKWERENRNNDDFGPTEAHRLAAAGDVKSLKAIASSKMRDILFQPDENGWEPIHEAARSNRVDAVKFLLKEGADADTRTLNGESALAIALQHEVGEDSEIAKVLREAGSRLEEF